MHKGETISAFSFSASDTDVLGGKSGESVPK